MGTDGRVVVGVDHTLSGLQALRRAVAEARARRQPLHAVRAWKPAPTSWYVSLAEQREHEAAAASQLVTEAFVETMGGVPTDLPVELIGKPGIPGEVLVEHANRTDDLLVVGTGSRRFWRRWLRDNVAWYCLAWARCPVLVVPPPALTLDASPRALRRQLHRELDRLLEPPGGKPA
ncbi:MAG TPA: universal stress protein [Natronosporangium sp.]